MKKHIIFILPVLISSQLFAFIGFGFQGGQSLFNASASSPNVNTEGVSITNGAFENAANFGAYIYLDVIPFIDLEVDMKIQSDAYPISFDNGTSPVAFDFPWVSSSLYFTARKEIFGYKIPFLMKTKVFAGGGYNKHWAPPLPNEEMITDLLGGDIQSETAGLTSGLTDYLEDRDNWNTSSGFHLQGGLQFKLLIFDSFAFYRHVFAKDVVPGKNGFGSLNFRLGLGF